MDPEVQKRIDAIKASDPDGEWVFRGMTAADRRNLDAGNGIITSAEGMKDNNPPPPYVHDTVLGHVARKGDKDSSHYISTSVKEVVANKYDSGNGIVAINLKKLSPEQRAEVVDISNPAARTKAYGPEPTDFNKRIELAENKGTPEELARHKAHTFKKDAEVLIKGNIPAEACQLVRRDASGRMLDRRQSCALPPPTPTKKSSEGEAKVENSKSGAKTKEGAAKNTKKSGERGKEKGLAGAKSKKSPINNSVKGKKSPSTKKTVKKAGKMKGESVQKSANGLEKKGGVQPLKKNVKKVGDQKNKVPAKRVAAKKGEPKPIAKKGGQKMAGKKNSTAGGPKKPKAPAQRKAAEKKQAPAQKSAPKKKAQAPRIPAPKKVAPKKAAPKKVAPKKVAPKKVVPKKVAPKNATPKKVAPKKAAPKNSGKRK
ncbi:hypothetical protein BC829DRAFT_415524 [Chytridium lagenaria]|nr:hypothetical protein BC829DRAFT_415524 [Chytridium lagenaria]